MGCTTYHPPNEEATCLGIVLNHLRVIHGRLRQLRRGPVLVEEARAFQQQGQWASPQQEPFPQEPQGQQSSEQQQAFAGSAGFPAAGAAEEAGAAAAALANLTAVTHFTASDELHTLDSILKSRNDLRWKHVSKRPRESRLFLASGMTERVWILSSCCSHLMKLLPIPFDLLVSGSMRYTLGYGRSGIPPTVCARLSN